MAYTFAETSGSQLLPIGILGGTRVQESLIHISEAET
jgi:hypothetical protein